MNHWKGSLIRNMEFFSKQSTKIPSTCSVQSREMSLVMARISFVQIATRQARALHEAFRSWEAGDCLVAIVGGVRIHFPLTLDSNTLSALINTRPHLSSSETGRPCRATSNALSQGETNRYFIVEQNVFSPQKQPKPWKRLNNDFINHWWWLTIHLLRSVLQTEMMLSLHRSPSW